MFDNSNPVTVTTIYPNTPKYGLLKAYKLNNYLGVAAIAETSRHNNYFKRNCHMTTRSYTPPVCDYITNVAGITINQVNLYLVKLSNIDTASGFDIMRREFLRVGVSSRESHSNIVNGNLTLNYNINVKSEITTPEIIINEPNVYFTGAVGDRISKQINFSVKNSNQTTLSPDLYNLKITTPTRVSDTIGSIGASRFTVTSGASSNLLLNGSPQSSPWWPSIQANATENVPLNFTFDLYAPGGEVRTIVTLQATIP
ncbi:hypothetical protein [Vibrio brasiliensis]